MFLFKSNVFRPSGAVFLICLKRVNFCGVLFCGFFFLRELINPKNEQKLKPAKFSCDTVIQKGADLGKWGGCACT